jgi:hypothetical protein
MYIESVPNRNSPPAILLRESFRDGTKIKKRTIANLQQFSFCSNCPGWGGSVWVRRIDSIGG